MLKPDVVMFGELLPEAAIERAFALARRDTATARRRLLARGLSGRRAAARDTRRGRRVRDRQQGTDRARRARGAEARRVRRRDAVRRGRGAPVREFDVVVVGSGFGGSVAALRLAEKGYSVCVLEAGRRFGPDDFPRTSWDLRRYLYAPRLGLHGIQRLTLLHDVLVLSGAGVGGGSLVYANTLYEPLEDAWTDPGWKAELAPYYALARKMLGAARVPFETPADLVMRRVAERMGVADSYHQPEVAVYFGEPGEEADDPYFDGARPPSHGLHPLRRLHGRLPPRRQEHARPQLPLPRRAPGRGRRPRARGDAPDALRRGLGGAGGAAGTAARRARALPRRPGRARRRRARDGRAAPPLGARRPARGRARAHELRGDRRRDRAHGEGRLLDRGRDHLVDPSGRADAHRAGALSARLELDGAARDACWSTAGPERRASSASSVSSLVIRSRSSGASRCGAGRSGRSSCS